MSPPRKKAAATKGARKPARKPVKSKAAKRHSRYDALAAST